MDARIIKDLLESAAVAIDQVKFIVNEKNGEERLNASIVNLNIEKIRLIK